MAKFASFKSLLSLILAVGILGGVPQTVRAASLYWSGNGTTLGGTGTWDTALLRWGTSPAGPFATAWNNANGDTAIFGGQYVGLPTVTLGSAITTGGLTFNYGGYTIAGGGNILSLTGVNAPIQVDQGMATISASLADSGGGLLKTGAGMLYLNADNSAVTGNMTVNAGYLRVDTSANALGSGSLVLNGGTLDLTNSGNLAYNRNTIITANSAIYIDPRGITANTSVVNTMGTLAIGSQTLTVLGMTVSSNANFVAGLTFGATTLSGDAFFNVHNRTNGANTLLTLGAVSGTGNLAVGGRGGNVTFSSTIDSTVGGITKYSFQNAGTLTFNDVVSATGPVTNYGGTMVLSGNTASLATTDLRLLGGTFQFGSAISQANISRLTGSPALTLGGGIMSLMQPASGTVTETLGTLTLKAGVSSLTITGGSSGTYRLNVDSIASREVGSVLSFSASANFPVRFYNVAPTLTGNIIGGWAVNGTSWATVSGVGADVGSAAFESTTVNTLTPTDNVNQSIVGGASLTANNTINSLRLTGNTVYNALDLGGNTLVVTTGGIMTNSTATNQRAFINNGTITADTSISSEVFLLTQGSTGMNFGIGAVIADNGSPVSVVRGGDYTGTVYLSGVNTYTGQTVLATRSSNNNYGFSVTNPTTPTVILTERQLGAYPTSFSANKVVLNNGALMFQDYVPASWSANRGLTLGGMGGTIWNNSAVATNYILPADITGTGPLFLRNVTNGVNVILSGNNSFDGQVTMGGPGSNINFLTIGNIGSGPTSLGNPTNPTNGILRQSGNNGSLTFVGVGNQSSNRDILEMEADSANLRASGSGSLTLTGTIYLEPNQSRNLQLGGTGLAILSGTILQTDNKQNNGILKQEGGTWRLAGQNTYTGTTTVSGGVLEITTIGNVGAGPSSLGAPTTTANGTVGLGGGTLRFVGSTDQSTDRAMALTVASAIESSGSANLTLRGGFSGAFGLTLSGTGNGFISGSNVIATGAGALTKTGPGTWTLNTSAVNTYTGATSINGGTLVLDFSNLATPTNLISSTTAVTFGSGFSAGTLSIIAKSSGTTSQTLGTVTFPQDSGSAKIALNTNGGGGLTLAMGAASFAPYGRTTNFTGFNVGATTTVTSSNFGVTTNGLYPWVTINNTEFATATSSNTTLAIYSGYTGALPTGATVGANSYTLATDQTQTATLTFTGLKIGPINAPGQGLHLSTFALSPNGTSGIIFDGTGTNGYTIDGTTGWVSTGTNFAVHVAGNQPLTIAAPIKFEGNTYAFTKGGDGTLILSGNNTSGSTTPTPVFRVGAGTLQAGSTTAFSALAGMSVSMGATLSLNGFNNAVNYLVGAGTVTNGGADDATLTFGNNAGSTRYEFGAGGTNLPVQPWGIMTDGTGGGLLHLNKVGSSVQVLSGNNTFTGNVTVSEGILAATTLTDAGVVGPLGAGTTLILGSPNRQGGIETFGTHNYATNRNITLVANGVGVLDVYNGSFNGIAAQTLFGDGALYSGNITGSGQLAKTSLGNLFLSGTNTYGGATNVVSGTLQFNNASAIGGSGASVLVMKNGSVAAGYAMDQAFLNRIDPASTGVVALGASTTSSLDMSALPNVSLGAAQNYSLAGTLTPANSTYKLGGGLGTLFIQNANTLSGNNSLIVTPNNTFQASVVIADAQSYTGPTSVVGTIYPARPVGTPWTDSPSTLIIAGATAGIASTSNITINSQGLVRMVASAGDPITSKLGSAPITMNGGALQYYNDGSAANFAQNIGAVTLRQGMNMIGIATTTGQTSILTMASLTRNATNFATVDFASPNTTTAQIIVTGGVTLGEWATYGAMAGFADINGSNQIVKAAETGPITTVSGFASATTNYFVTGNNTLTSGNGTARTIRISGGTQTTTTISLGAADVLSCNAFMTVAGTNQPLVVSTVVGQGTVKPASGTDIYFYQGNAGSTITMNANIVLPAGGTLIRSANSLPTNNGNSGLTLAGNNTFDNLVINYGSVTITNANSLPATANIVMNGGSISVPAITVNNPITINADAAVSDDNNNSTFAGNITLNNNAMMVIAGQGNKTFSGAISGTGGIAQLSTNNGNEVLSGNVSNTFTGAYWFYGANDGGNQNPTMTLSKVNAIAIPGDIYLGWQSNTSNTGASFPRNERLILGTAGSGGDQIADTSVMYFSGGALADAGDFELNGKTETIGGIQSQMTGDGLIQNTSTTAVATLALAPANGKSYSFSGTIRDGSTRALALIINGSGTGTQALAGPNSFTGGIQVVGGSLLINNSIGSGSGTGSVTVYSGGTLGGTGIIGPAGTSNVTINAGGILAPGIQTGTLAGPLTVDLGGTTSGVAMASTASLLFQLGAPGSSDSLQFFNYGTGAGRLLNLDAGGNTVNFTTLAGFGAGTYTLFQFYSDGGSTLTDSLKPITGLTVGSGISPTYSALFDYSPTGQINLVVTLVPEPGTLALLAFGSLAVLHRRKQKAA